MSQHPPPYDTAIEGKTASDGPPPGAVYQQQPCAVIVSPPPAQMTDPPSDYLVSAIFVTACCCLPFGVVAIIKSMDTRNAIERGDAQAAHSNSRDARKWSLVALGCGIATVTIAIIVLVVSAIAY
ncbi:proline-rich transmembrane protein 1-like [Tubulanus polymorphus]|uniref:proline-rich transmembrane protein 1-like n=1 Tax=Tubulanus polymorphus TaxID=672921 RepID=UPI003DA65456